eukprot:CAMPEP_0185024288 /NCGR_PEP_ID=MMETSP1103-20130426/7296_1 /TAXON_ID=36769 /ORGANISM="Paraphysomonas bandaiensis, Strain Caron Lab Isolate" /LENGTH=510 /DNA_ID=CAMNT_0027557209 /DNA_START=44 /DNA_END=1576 /DNA_ORIENTATION=-
MQRFFIFTLLSSIYLSAHASDPVPDTSEECLECQSQMQQLQDTWTNETTVEDILKEMQANCKEYKFLKREVCDKIAEVFVQIPPALFEGMEDLAWPIPEAMCATIHKCEVQCCGADSPPEQVHLSLASSDRSLMGVTWVSLNQTASVVQYGLSASDLSSSQSGSLDTYTSAGWVGTIHRATMVDLQPSTTYFYRVGDGNIWSEVFSFTTLTPGQTVTYAVIADMDFGEASDGTVSDLVSLVENGDIQAVIHSGDISYADGYEPHWDVFFNKIEPIASRVPYMVTPGNHEFWYNFSAYKHRFTMPGVLDGGGSGDNMFYSYNIEHAHFLACNSESPIDTPQFSDAELEWMEKDLTNVDRSSTPWVIAHFHRPMYCSSDHACIGGSGGAEYLLSKAEDVFYSHSVDLVLQGHVHSYERTYPVYQQSRVSTSYAAPGAPVYVLQGASGNREGNKGSYPPQEELPEWSAATHVDVGLALLTVSADQIQWKYYSSSVTGESPQGPVLLDEFTLTR